MTERTQPIDWPLLAPIRIRVGQAQAAPITQEEYRALWAKVMERMPSLSQLNAEVERLSALADRPWLRLDHRDQ